MNTISSAIIPAVIFVVAVLALLPKKNYFEAFLAGAKEGAMTCFNLLPAMAALMVALSMLSASGALDALTAFLAPFGEKIGVPTEILPLLITRPVSGSASNAAFAELIERYGADSFPSLCAAVIMGSSDTLIYVISVYFSPTQVKYTRHAFPAAALTMLLCIFVSCGVARVLF